MVASSQHTPYLLKGRAHLGTGQCSREGVVTNGNGLLSVVHIHLSEENKEVHVNHTNRTLLHELEEGCHKEICQGLSMYNIGLHGSPIEAHF